MKEKSYCFETAGKDSMRVVLRTLNYDVGIKEISELVDTVWPPDEHEYNDFETLSDMKDLFKKFIKFAADKFDNSGESYTDFKVLGNRVISFKPIAPGVRLLVFYWISPKNNNYIGGAGAILAIKEENCSVDLENRLLDCDWVSWKDGNL